jgi:hypothetical protein
MSELKDSTAGPRRAQGFDRCSHDPRRHVAPERLAAAEKTHAVVALLRAARRCSRCLGRDSDAALLDLIREQLAVTASGGAK